MDKDRIVVMGGFFNPPTIAHLTLMETSLQAIHADVYFLAGTDKQQAGLLQKGVAQHGGFKQVSRDTEV